IQNETNPHNKDNHQNITAKHITTKYPIKPPNNGLLCADMYRRYVMMLDYVLWIGYDINHCD
ncbi:hypothetical protein ACYCJW_22570, partial [Klebsiella pneumoniae]